MMQYKKLFQGFVALVLLLSVLGGLPHAFAQGTVPVVVIRDLTYWDATYIGYVADTRFEKWPLLFTEAENFSVTADPNGDGFNTVVILLDANGAELARGTNTLTASQAAGSYYVQVQPETGAGFYTLTIRRVEIQQGDVSVSVDPAVIKAGEKAVVSVTLNNIPAEGYTSAEVICVSSDASKVNFENVVVLTAFGEDPAIAQKSELENGRFITGIAGSNGQRAYPPALGGNASASQQSPGSKLLTVDARSPTPPPTGGNLMTAITTSDIKVTIMCKVRVSNGDGVLIDLPEATTELTITTGGTTPPLVGAITGNVLAGKLVTVRLYKGGDTLVTSATVGELGSFNFSDVPVGDYTIVATADGYLSASGSVTVGANETTSKSEVTLLAGDIDGNNVIDQYDALTIGMSYNTAEPAGADLNNDGIINVLDLEKLAANYRATGPIDWP